MKHWLRFALIPLLGAASVSAFAAPHLSQRACHRYPFVKPAHEVTHGELMQELKDLSLVGYEEHAVDNDYPSDLEAAQQRLCAGAGSGELMRRSNARQGHRVSLLRCTFVGVT
jgi:hypothetical protein